MLRLRHDLVIIGRTAMPLPSAFAQRLGPLITGFGADAGEFLRGSATALVLRHHPPSVQALEGSLKAYDSAVASLRSEGLTVALSGGEVERLICVGFALEQLHQNFADLSRCVQEYARGTGAKSRS